MTQNSNTGAPTIHRDFFPWISLFHTKCNKNS